MLIWAWIIYTCHIVLSYRQIMPSGHGHVGPFVPLIGSIIRWWLTLLPLCVHLTGVTQCDAGILLASSTITTKLRHSFTPLLFVLAFLVVHTLQVIITWPGA